MLVDPAAIRWMDHFRQQFSSLPRALRIQPAQKAQKHNLHRSDAVMSGLRDCDGGFDSAVHSSLSVVRFATSTGPRPVVRRNACGGATAVAA
jgi:hypothetical protein